jgi:glycosyltransferase involved in cell wall biosynthesis
MTIATQHLPLPESPGASVIFCVNRGNPHLRAAIDSVLTQTHKDFEFLIGANACSDELFGELLEYSARDSRIRLFRTALPQLAFTLNYVIEQSKGELLIRMDADDVCEPQRFERLIAAAEATPDAQVIGSWTTLIDEADQVIGSFNPPASAVSLRRRMLISSPIAHPTVAFRKKFWLESRGYLGGFVSEDFDLWLRALARGVTIINVPEPLLRYRMHSAQVSRSRLGYAETAAHWYRELLARPGLYTAAGWAIATTKAILMPLRNWLRHKLS